jgi:hypothetical protein
MYRFSKGPAARLGLSLGLLLVGAVASPAQTASEQPAAAPVRALSADAQTQLPDRANPPMATVTADNAWHSDLMIYLWMPGLHGTAGTPDHQLSVHASPADLLSNFRFGLMGTIEARKNRWVLPLDMMWVRLGDDKAFGADGVTITTADVKFTEFILTPKVGYRIVDKEKVTVDALTGFRYWHLGQSFDFNPSITGRSLNGSQNWVDPLVGARIQAHLSPKVEMTIAGDVGGWGAGSQLDYQMVAALGYRFKPKWVLEGGWRYLSVDYRTSTSIFDTIQSGVFLGVTVNLK